MATTVLRPLPGREVLRDPVLLLPVVVAAGLAVGRLGEHGDVAGTRIAADLALSWALAAAGLAVWQRPRWRRAGMLLFATSFAVLGADLGWAHSHPLSTAGSVFAGLWVAFLIHLVLTFPDGRPWSRWAAVTIVAAYAVTLGGQFVVDRAQEITGIILALVVLVVLVQHARILGGPARRTQGPLLVAAAVTALTGLVWLGSASSSIETLARAVAVSLPLGIVLGIMWSQLRQPELAELVVELPTQATAGLQERLARALGDPTLDVAYRLGDGRYVDATGRPVALPQDEARAVTAVTVGGEEVAALLHDPALLDEPALVESVRAAAGLVFENERLAAEVRSQLAEVRESRGRIVSAADAERRRIERNLHDGAQQRLVALSVALGLAASRADAATAHVLSRAQDDVEGALAELRELARGIHPTLLKHDGLDAAVAALARRAPLPVTVHGSAGERLPDQIELAAYFVVSEALTNVAKHAAATEASVLLEREDATLRVAVADDGVGGARLEPDSGLAGLQDRLDALDATLTVESEPGRGTTVRATIPCAS